jgi:hypothetical protein
MTFWEIENKSFMWLTEICPDSNLPIYYWNSVQTSNDLTVRGYMYNTWIWTILIYQRTSAYHSAILLFHFVKTQLHRIIRITTIFLQWLLSGKSYWYFTPLRWVFILTIVHEFNMICMRCPIATLIFLHEIIFNFTCFIFTLTRPLFYCSIAAVIFKQPSLAITQIQFY